MIDESAQIKFKDHFKLYVSLKDQIIFESELQKEMVPFYTEKQNSKNPVSIERYFLLDSDRKKIDEILIRNEIIASTETIQLTDYKELKKINTVYYTVFAIVLAIMLIIVFIDSLNK